jgi:hypothetical protein
MKKVSFSRRTDIKYTVAGFLTILFLHARIKPFFFDFT